MTDILPEEWTSELH